MANENYNLVENVQSGLQRNFLMERLREKPSEERVDYIMDEMGNFYDNVSQINMAQNGYEAKDNDKGFVLGELLEEKVRTRLTNMGMLSLLDDMFVRYEGSGSIYFVSRRLLDEHAEIERDIKTIGQLEYALENLTINPNIDVVRYSRRLDDGEVINIIFQKHADIEKYPKKDLPHVSLLATNTTESLDSNGVEGIFPDSFIKGFSRFMDHLPTPLRSNKR